MSKKSIIAIITVIVLLIAAGLSVGMFLYGRGETEAVNGGQTSDQNQTDDGNQVVDRTQTGENTENSTTEQNAEGENADGVENNQTVNNNDVVDNEGNAGNNEEVTTDANVDNVGDTTITRVEEQEKLVSEDFLDWWQPMEVAINPTVLGVNRPQITVEKSAITGIHGDEFVYAGQNITYVINVTNNGNTAVKNIEITDKIPENTTFVSMQDATILSEVVGTKTTVGDANVVDGIKWIVTIPAGETVSASFTVNVNNGVTGTILNTAIANGQESNETETIIAEEGIKVEKVADKTIVTNGDIVNYTITVENTGNVTLNNLEVADTLTTSKGTQNLALYTDVACTTSLSKIDILPVGEVVTLYTKYVVTQEDINAQVEISNIATVGEIPSAPVIVKPERIHKVEFNVPGEDGSKQHDEVILMVDGSYSMDNEWPHMKNTIIEIGKACLNGNGNTQLTLMAFGMGDNEVLTHVKTVNELETALGELPGTLLYGRSSTNCEAGFTGVEEYINGHDQTLNEAHVIFISDGNINTDETPHLFYNWKQNPWLRYTPIAIAETGLLGFECPYIIYEGKERSEAFKTIFGAEAAPNIVSETATEEQIMAWAELVWKNVYEEAGLIPENAYPVSDVERAFVAYDDKNNTRIQDIFYYALIGRSYPERWNRTPAAGNALAANEKVKSLYMVDYDSYTSWMDTGITAENSEYIRSTNGIAGLITALQGVITNLSKTPYNDVVLTTYTSKWVNLDQASISIVDNTTNTTIYTVEQGWLIEKDQRPTAQEVPVKIEVVPASEYSNGGEAVEGNTQGNIYKITWYVKDGALLRSNSYRLEYNVTGDYLENGYEYDSNYFTNGNAFIEYKDENGNNKKEELAK